MKIQVASRLTPEVDGKQIMQDDSKLLKRAYDICCRFVEIIEYCSEQVNHISVSIHDEQKFRQINFIIPNCCHFKIQSQKVVVKQYDYRLLQCMKKLNLLSVLEADNQMQFSIKLLRFSDREKTKLWTGLQGRILGQFTLSQLRYSTVIRHSCE